MGSPMNAARNLAPSPRERPILFSGPMVRAILEGRKTQTRRLAKVRKSTDHLLKMNPVLWATRCPYGQPGDRLWVRETIRHWDSQPNPGPGPGREISVYAADNTLTKADAWPWRNLVLPSIHCPRGLSRITLEVTGVRVERLQDISHSDAMREGAQHFADIPTNSPYPSSTPRWSMESPTHTDECLGSARMAFANYWIKLSGQESWDLNPWVWVVEFRRVAP